MHFYVHCSIIYNSQDWEAAQVLKCPSVDEWIKQLWNIYTVGYYLAVKKKKILPFATAWMDLGNIMLSDISQPEKYKLPYDFTHMWSVLNKLNKEAK